MISLPNGNRKKSDKSGHNHRSDLMSTTDVYVGWVALALFMISLIATIVIYLIYGGPIYGILPIMSVPLLVLGVLGCIMDRKWMLIVLAAILSIALYFVHPYYVLIPLYLFICTEGIIVISDLIRRFSFYRILNSIEVLGTSSKPSVVDRVVEFTFNIPDGIDTRNITMVKGVEKTESFWHNVLKSGLLALVPCTFMWVTMFVDPFFSSLVLGASIGIFTIVLYAVLIVTPWYVFRDLNIRIVTGGGSFGVYDGFRNMMVRTFLAIFAMMLIVTFLFFTGPMVLLYILASIGLVFLATAAVSILSNVGGGSEAESDIVSAWKDFRPVDLYSGYGGVRGSSMDDGIPGTPKRDPESCFRQ